MVVGARTGKHYWGSFSKRWSRTFLLRIVEFVVGRHIPDVNSGFRVFNKAVALEHANRISSGFSFTTTITLAFFFEEKFVKYLDIEYYQREGKSKVHVRRDSLRMLQIVTQAILYYNPLKLFLLLCFLSIIVGVSAALVALIAGALFQALILVSISVLVSIILGGLGFVAEALRLSRLA
jgi:polyisoprenyl-phosphate glycosyltransferase